MPVSESRRRWTAPVGTASGQPSPQLIALSLLFVPYMGRVSCLGWAEVRRDLKFAPHNGRALPKQVISTSSLD